MKRLLFAMCIIFFNACAMAATSIPPELEGIWATNGAVFKGEALMNGQALYLDSDGTGASLGGDGKAVIGVRIAVTSYSPTTNTFAFDVTENGKVMHSGMLTYDPTRKIIFAPQDPKQTYERRYPTMSALIRRSIGLEEKAKVDAPGGKQ